MHTVFCFTVLCCGYTLTNFPISIRLTSLALWQSNDCPSASKATLMNMDKYFMWIYYEGLHNHNKAKHNKTVCIFLGIYCSSKIGKKNSERTLWWSPLIETNGFIAWCGEAARVVNDIFVAIEIRRIIGEWSSVSKIITQPLNRNIFHPNDPWRHYDIDYLMREI